MLTVKQLLEIAAPKTQVPATKFWVDAAGVHHSISSGVSTDIVGGFKRNPSNRGRRYYHGEAIYYKV